MATLPVGTEQLSDLLMGSTALLSDPINTTSAPATLLSGLVDGPTDGLTPDSTTPTPATQADTSSLASPTSLLDNVLDGDGNTAQPGGITDLIGGAGALNLNPDGSSPLDLVGMNGTLQPIVNAVNTEIKDVHALLEVLAHETGTQNLIHGVTSLGETVGLGQIGVVPPAADGHSNLLTDVIDAPHTVLDGGGLGGLISQLGGDLTDVVTQANVLVDTLLIPSSTPDPLNPIPSLIQELGHDLQSLPLLSVNGGNNDGDGGLLGGIVGNLTGSSTGHLIDASVGPQQDNGLVANLLSQPEAGPHNAVQVSAIDTGPSGPHLADLGLLTGGLDNIHLPNLGGAGTDSLTGSLPLSNLLHAVTASAGAPAPATAPAGLDVVHDLLAAPLTADHGPLHALAGHIV